MARVFIGIGSNIQQPLLQVFKATEYLQKLPETSICLVSSCYQSSPMGPADQPDFINRVVCLETALLPLQLLALTQEIEQRQGRVKLVHWGPRVIDLDILLYGDQIISLPQLIIPHIGLKDRAFFLYPLMEIAPDLILPDGEKLSDLKANCVNYNIKLMRDSA